MARTVLVTGAGRGLGLETARQLAERGDRVILTGRRAEDARARSDELAAEGLDVEHRKLDITDRRDIERIAAEFSPQHPLDVLINNAAVLLSGFNADVVRRTLAANLFGTMDITDALLPKIADGGTIVNVSSGLGELSAFAPELRARFLDPNLDRAKLRALADEFTAEVAAGTHSAHGWPSSAYRVSKAGLNAYTRILARELAPRRIRVNAVCPGWVRTRMGGEAARRDVPAGAASIVWAATLDRPVSGGFYRDGRELGW